MKSTLAGVVAGAAFGLVRRTILLLPDSWLAFIFSLLHRLISRATGDESAAAPLAELTDIFSYGRPLTDTVRKMMREADPVLIKSAARCLARPGPYGIE